MEIPRIHGQEPGENVLVIAEIGKNFIQSEEDRPVKEYIQNACALIDAAKEAGADAVKFQTHNAIDEQLERHVVSPHFTKADRYAWVQRNAAATPMEFWNAIVNHCKAQDITFFSTPMSRNAARMLQKLDVPFWKVGSGDVHDYLLLDELIATNKPIIISTGMVNLEELKHVVAHLERGSGDIVILYCISHYPCPPEYFNLHTMRHLQEQYPHATIGFSDHSLSSDAALAAVKLGARVVEKHFSFSRELWGSDHKASITPDEMQAMVRAIRTCAFETVDETPFLGIPGKDLEGAENPYRPFFRKMLVASADMPEGTVLTKEHLYAMRPLDPECGIPADRLYEVLGKTIDKSLKTYDPIPLDILS